MNDMVLCGNCCWIGIESQLEHAEQRHPINAALKSVIKKNNLKCYAQSCPDCGSDLIYRKVSSEIKAVFPPTVQANKRMSKTETEEEFDTTLANIQPEPVQESSNELSNAEDDDLDSDFVNSLLKEASDLEESIEVRPVELQDFQPENSSRQPKADREVTCDRCDKKFIIPVHVTHNSRRCDACMEEIRRMIGE